MYEAVSDLPSCRKSFLIFKHLAILSPEIAEKFIMPLGTVTMRVIALVFMFVATTRFPVKHSIVNVLPKLYGKILVENVRKFEKYDFKYKTAILDLDFLLTCKEKSFIPSILRFKISNR